MTDPQAAPLSAEELAEAHPHWRLGVEHMAWHRRWIAHWKARAEAAESALTAPDVSAAKVEGGWKPISDPPENTSEGCSITLWVWSKEYGGNVGFYTPFYLGHEREKEQLWRYAHLPWGFKPTHWRLLPTPPHHSPTVSSAPEVKTRGSVPTTATEK